MPTEHTLIDEFQDTESLLVRVQEFKSKSEEVLVIHAEDSFGSYDALCLDKDKAKRLIKAIQDWLDR